MTSATAPATARRGPRLRIATKIFGSALGLLLLLAVVAVVSSRNIARVRTERDTVNVASRLEGVRKVDGTRILIGEDTRLLAGDAIEVREIDSIRVVGRQDPLRIFELLAEAGSLDEERSRLRDAFELGLARYRAGDLAGARRHFQACGRAPSG